MRSKPIMLLMIATLAIGIFALPSTVALFSGQHSWYDLNENRGINDVPCEKCHGEIKSEMIHGDNGAHRDLTCAMCHRAEVFAGYIFARGNYTTNPAPEYWSGTIPGEEAHAASTIECMDCHGGVEDSGTHSHPRESGGDVELQLSGCTPCHTGGSQWF
ncbi:MAG: hypothetical protein OCU18_09080, partial [Candidatus Syntrophoarchaeum sp.]|nr:hypothetical protein [Candidatus Syntrophoarchaeum sp.]